MISVINKDEKIGWRFRMLCRKKKLHSKNLIRFNSNNLRILIKQEAFERLTDFHYKEETDEIENLAIFFTNFKLLLNENIEFCQLNKNFSEINLDFIEENLAKIILNFLEENQITNSHAYIPSYLRSRYASNYLKIPLITLKDKIVQSFLVLPNDFILSEARNRSYYPIQTIKYNQNLVANEMDNSLHLGQLNTRCMKTYSFSTISLSKYFSDEKLSQEINQKIKKFQNLFKYYQNRLNLIKRYKEKVLKRKFDSCVKIINWYKKIKSAKKLSQLHKKLVFLYEIYLDDLNYKKMLINRIINSIKNYIFKKNAFKELKIKLNSIKAIQIMMHKIHFRIKLNERIRKKRILKEYHENNQKLFFNTFYYYYTKNLWDLNKKKSSSSKSRMDKDKILGEINKLFILYSFNDGIELSKLLKIFNTIFDTYLSHNVKAYTEFYEKHDENLRFYLNYIENYNNFEEKSLLSNPNLPYSNYLREVLNPTIIEKLFNKSKSNSQDKRLTYDGFLTFLSFVSIYYFLGYEPSKDFWSNKGIDLELDDILGLHEGEKFSTQKMFQKNLLGHSSRPSSKDSSRSNSPQSRLSSPSSSRPQSPNRHSRPGSNSNNRSPNSRPGSPFKKRNSRPGSPSKQRTSRPNSPLRQFNQKLESLTIYTENYLKNKYFTSNNRKNLNFLVKNKIKLRENLKINHFNYYKTHPVTFQFGSLKGREAWILKFYEKFLIRTPDIIKITDYLNKKSSLRITINFLVHNTKRIQNFYRIYLLKKNLKRIYSDYLKRELHKKQNEASLVITNFFKFFLIKKTLIEKSLSVYSKFIDYNTEKVYYFNNNSKESSWKKPKFLYEKDCTNVILMPQRHELYTMSCDICLQSYVSIFCKSCINFYCLNCFTNSHRSGLRLKHEKINVNLCNLCDIQVATRFCYNCQENCCDYCYNYYHKSGRLRYHSYKNYYKVCTICNDFTGQWFEYYGNNYIHNKNQYQKLQNNEENSPNEFKVKFNNKFDTFNELFFSLNCNNFDFLYIPAENINNMLSYSKKNNSMIYKENISKEKFIQKSNEQVNKIWCTRCYCDFYKEHPQERIASIEYIEQYQRNLLLKEEEELNLTEEEKKLRKRKEKEVYIRYEESKHLINLIQSSLEKIQFYGEEIEKYYYLKKKSFENQRINKIYTENQLKLIARRKDVSAILIQRIFRGFICRKKLVNFIEERKKFFNLRKMELNKKNDIIYKLKNFLGIAPILLSDTPLEKINKMYPKYYRKIIEECLENNWQYGCELVRQHDEIFMLYNSTLSPVEATLRKSLVNDLNEQEMKDLQNDKNTFDNCVFDNDNGRSISQKEKSIKSYLLSSSTSGFKHSTSIKSSSVVAAKGASLVNIFLIKIKISYYKKMFEMLHNKIQLKKFNLEILSINYYHAEESGIYSLSKLKVLKKILLKNEKVIKNLLIKYNKMHNIIKKLEYSIIQYVGPRFLQNLISDFQKNGKLLPFKLNLKKNSRIVSVVYPTATELDDYYNEKYSPLKKKDEILQYYYEEVLNKGREDESNKEEIEAEKIFSQEKIKNKFSSTQEIEENSKDCNENENYDFLSQYDFIKRNLNFSRPGSWRKLLREGDYIYINGVQYKICLTIPTKKKKSIPKSQKIYPMDNENRDDEKSTSLSDDEDFDNDSDFSNLTDEDLSNKQENHEQEKNVSEIITEDSILLDHPWMLEDMENVPVYKAISSLFYMKPVNFFSRQIKKSYPIQKLIAINSINNHYIGKFWEKLSLLVDENSPLYQLFLNYSTRSYKKRDKWLQQSYSKITLNYDFYLRKFTTDLLKIFFKNLIYDNIKLSFNMLKFFVKDNIKEESSYDYWNRSLKKKLICCEYEISSSKSITLGEFSMDPLAPCEVMREYICRKFRVKLNETIGESFVFIRTNVKTKKEEYLKRDDEFKTHSKDYIVHKLNNITFIQALTVTIRKDKERGRVFIPPFENEASNQENQEIKDLEIDDLLQN